MAFSNYRESALLKGKQSSNLHLAPFYLVGLLVARVELAVVNTHKDTCISVFRAAITKYPKWSGRSNRNLLSRVFGGCESKSRYEQGWFHLRSVREGFVPDLSSWLIDGYLPYACLSVSRFPLSWGHQSYWIGVYFYDLILIWLLLKDPISK